VQQRLTTRYGYNGSATFIYGRETLGHSKTSIENVFTIRYLAATGTGQVAAKKRFEHQYQGIALYSSEFLAQNIACDPVYLYSGYPHAVNSF
jgi:hypothetical protein